MTAWIVFRRELRALVRLPQTYAIAAAFLVISGIFWVNILISTETPDLSQYYSNIASTLLVLVPIIAMRSFAEERRSGGLDIVLTWPSSRLGLVLGKFAVNTLFVWVLSSIVWVYFGLVGHVGSIEGGRTAGGYVGLLLLSMSFSALALMVSARASSPTAAAFLGFGLLLFLWILEYAPGWIGEGLRSLGPARHFSAFPRGAIDAEDVGYFALVVVVGLGLALASLNRERPGAAAGALVRRGVALGAVVVIWTGGSAVAGNLNARLDLTPSHRNTVTGLTRRILRDVHGPVQLTGFFAQASAEAEALTNLARQYRSAGATVSVSFVDPDTQPARARQAGVSLPGQILVELGGRHELIEDTNQVSLTSALHRLSGAAAPRACFTIGHGERSLTDKSNDGISALSEELTHQYYEARPLSLAVLGAAEELRRCGVVVVAGPRVPLLAGEIDLLAAYTANNGRLVVMADMGSPREQLNGLLGPWGVTLGAGTVSDLSALAGDPASIVSDTYPSKSPVTLHLAEIELPVVLTAAVPLEQTAASDERAGESHFSPLVRSSPKSWVEPATVAGAPAEGKAGAKRLEGPFVLAGVLDASRVVGEGDAATIARTRIGVLGSVSVASNRVLDILGNREFVSGLVQWVSRQDDVIAAGRPPGGIYKLVLTERQKSRLIREGIVAPAAALLLLLPLPLLRLKRG